jgi:ubiquinone/menaquinone biosynthesis C-methylase UbiE
VYDELLVPRLFAPWAALLLAAVGVRPGQAVLDVATGPGTVARLAAQRVGSAGRVTGTDLSAPMLGVARSKPALPDSAPIEYVESPAAPLGVPDASFDVAVCQQGLQFFPDREAALREMRRALRPGGCVGLAVWGPLERCLPFAALHAALRDTVPADLADLLKAPFSFPSPGDLEEALRRTGFRLIRVETRSLPLVFELGVGQALAALDGSPLGPAIAALPDDTRRALGVAAAHRFAALREGASVRGDVESNVAVAQV